MAKHLEVRLGHLIEDQPHLTPMLCKLFELLGTVRVSDRDIKAVFRVATESPELLSLIACMILHSTGWNDDQPAVRKRKPLRH